MSRPTSSVPSGPPSTSRTEARDNPSEASYYQAAPSKEPQPLQPSLKSPSQKLPEAPWPNPQPPILASAPQKPQSHLTNSTSSQPSTASIQEGLTSMGSIHSSTHGGSLHVNPTQGRGFSSTSHRAENLSSQQPQANNGKSKVGERYC